MFGLVTKFIRTSKCFREVEGTARNNEVIIADMEKRFSEKLQMLCKCEHGFEYKDATKCRVHLDGAFGTKMWDDIECKERTCRVCGKVDYMSIEEYEITIGKELLTKNGYSVED